MEAQKKENSMLILSTPVMGNGKRRKKISRGLICYDEMGLDGIQTGQKRRRRRTKARPHGSVNIVDSLRVRFRTVVFSLSLSLCSLFKNKRERERWSILKIQRCGHRHTKRVREEMRLRHSQGSRPASSRRRLSESHRLIFVFSVLLLDLFFFFGHLSLLMHFLVQNRRGEGGQDFEGVKID